MPGTGKTADNLFVRSHTFVKDHDGAGSDVLFRIVVDTIISRLVSVVYRKDVSSVTHHECLKSAP
jgi:hypothetical protein